MIQTSAAIPVPARIPLANLGNDPLGPLWRLAGDLHTVRALVIAEHGLGLLCGLLRRGCLAATAIRFGSQPDADDYNLVVAAPKQADFSPERLIRQVRGGLAPDSKLVACVPNGPSTTAFIRRLCLNGFSVPPPVRLCNLTLLRADLRPSS